MESLYAGFRPPFIEDRYKRDLRYREQVDYACERGIPFSQFAGRVPSSPQAIWVDASLWEKFKRWVCANPSTLVGRWVESRVPVDELRLTGRVDHIEGEPLWLPEDRTVAMVWQKMQRTKCSRCGTWDWEWQENPEAWFADFWVCEGCKQVDAAHDRLHDKQKRDGMQVRLFKET